jgi:hypothetical protein
MARVAARASEPRLLRLEDDDVDAFAREFQRGGQTCITRADDADVGADALFQWLRLSRGSRRREPERSVKGRKSRHRMFTQQARA